MRVSFLPALVVILSLGCGGSTSPSEVDGDATTDDSSITEGGGDDTSTTEGGGDDSTITDDSMVPTDGATDSVAPTDSIASDVTPDGCSADLTACPGGCFDIKSDTNHCGSCATKCLTGQVCITASGATACACPTGKKICGMGGAATCSDTMTDNNNCGACGNRCASGETCTAGTCKCDTGASTCPGSTRCFDLTTDPLNCGMCGTRCPFGSTCSASKCACPTGADTLCPSFGGGNACTDPTEDVNNCGMCGHRCQDAEMCDGAGKCVCRTGLTSCTTAGGTFCVDTNTNPRNCGMCGKTCMTGENCEAGVCKTGMCAAGETRCGGGGGGTTTGACVNLEKDPLHCGDCGNTCNRDEMCVAGNCRRFRPALGCTTCPCTGCTGGTTCCAKPLAADTFSICVEGSVCP